MFIIDLIYKVSISEIEKFLPQHVIFLEENYKNGYIIMSGRKNPRNGGIMFSTIKDRHLLDKMIEKDPFKIYNLADYSITEFFPTKTNEELKFILED